MTESDRVENLTPRQLRAVALLVATGDPKTVAEAVGVSEVTLRRWRRCPAFAEALRAAGRRSAAEATSMLLAAQVAAVRTLQDALETGTPAARVRAAIALLELGQRAADDDIEERLRALEERTTDGTAPAPA